jgi:ABC-type polar amino acid transport system ATPase subunit
LIRVLLMQPHVILFDEPTSALDPQSAAAVEAW